MTKAQELITLLETKKVTQLKTKKGSYEVMQAIKALLGVSVGDYKYENDGEEIKGHDKYTTKELMKSIEYVPVVRITTSDGWIEATDPKGQIKSKL